MKEVGRVLVLPGTYSPVGPHHIELIERAKQVPDTKLVIVVPAYKPVHKLAQIMPSFDHRLAMTNIYLQERGILADGKVVVSDVEWGMSGETHETLDVLQSGVFWPVQAVLGSDWANIESWEKYLEILQRGVWIANRFGHVVTQSKLMPGMKLLPGEPISGCSGELRELARRKQWDGLVEMTKGPAMVSYMRSRKLYQYDE